MIQLGENIRRLRRARGLSQEELANRLNVSRQSVSLWEQGVTNPTVENIYAMAEVMEASFDDLLGDAPASAGTPLVARSFDELMQENFSAEATACGFETTAAPTSAPVEPTSPDPATPPARDGAPAASFSNTDTNASPTFATDGWDGQTVTPQVRAEARYYRYRRLKRGLTISLAVMLSGVALLIAAIVWAGYAATFPSVWSDLWGGFLLLLSLPIIGGGLIAVLITAVRAASYRKKMGDLFDLATYEELKRGGGDYATRRRS